MELTATDAGLGDDGPPRIFNIQLDPYSTYPGATIDVTAAVLDQSGVDTVTAQFFVYKAGTWRQDATFDTVRARAHIITRTVITDATGHYQDDYTPTTLGIWTLNASWPGNATYQGASSTSVSFTVTPQSSESLQLPWYIFLIAGVVGSLVVGSLFAIRRRHPRPPVMHQPPVCTHCGTPIPRDAAFCPECGTSHRVSSTRERAR
jgi:hypothetical protein